jgi:acyl dehydratase
MTSSVTPEVRSTPTRLTSSDVAVGDVLPRLVVDVTPRTVVMGASSSRDWQPQHHDYRHCVDVANLPDIFLNTPNQAGFIERYLTDWAGPTARLAKLGFRMKKSVVPGDALQFNGVVTAVERDDDVTFVDLDLELTVDGELVTGCAARIAIPTTSSDNPWARVGDAWNPEHHTSEEA